MTKEIKTHLVKGIIGIVVAVIVAILSTQNPVWKAVIALVVGLLVYGLLWVAPRLYQWLAVKSFEFFFYGLKEWTQKKSQQIGNVTNDSVWEWLDDQLLVAQGKYAFSLGCIAFRESNGQLECLLIKRRLPEIPGEILLWPGGRIKGFGNDIEIELNQLVYEKTGYHIKLVSANCDLLDSNAGAKETIPTWHPTKDNVQNELFLPPLIIMRQNRTQKYGVKGHIDLIYLAKVQDAQKESANVVWLREEKFERSGYPESELWNDTLTCINRAAQVYKRLGGTHS
jgi:hypothetical protein